MTIFMIIGYIIGIICVLFIVVGIIRFINIKRCTKQQRESENKQVKFGKKELCYKVPEGLFSFAPADSESITMRQNTIMSIMNSYPITMKR